jgi:hypothetical protein
VTPALFKQALISALVVAGVGLLTYLIIKLAMGKPMIVDQSIWYEMLPMLLIAGFLSRLFVADRKPK